ncbi:hypothetical protein Ahy_A10g046783 [Arachis hypogaea]|uniref:Uncharacterized protein n=1 Tax=Arachis hypogaea TaxID=3818 RepID=A0A445B0G9_ARAHY|nr:hypothetical protein Ahy_A10g046783 [Arachis hypogaea]
MLPTIQPGRDLTLTAADAHAAATFFKCISWQVEETLDLLNCPYHYVCETTYPANYPPYVDILVLLFATASYLVTLVIVATTARSRYSSSSSSTQRTTRKEELVVGGKVVRYRAWSLTTFMVVGVLCFRIICRIAAAGNNRIMLQRIKGLMERLSWLFIFLDCVYLAAKSPHHHHATLAASFGAILLLILLHLLKQASFLFSSMLPFPTHLIVNRNSLVKPL